MPRVGATLLKAAAETSSPEARNVVAYEVVFRDGGQMDLKCETREKIGYHLGGGLLRATAAATLFCRIRNCWIMSKDISQERFWAAMMVWLSRSLTFNRRAGRSGSSSSCSGPRACGRILIQVKAGDQAQVCL